MGTRDGSAPSRWLGWAHGLGQLLSSEMAIKNMGAGKKKKSWEGKKKILSFRKQWVLEWEELPYAVISTAAAEERWF